MTSNYEYLKKLGWLSSYSRQVLLLRYFLRIYLTGPSSLTSFDKQGVAKLDAMGPLFLARAGISLNAAVYNKDLVIHAPYRPSNRPTEFFLNFRNGSFIFKVESSNKPIPRCFISSNTHRQKIEYEFGTSNDNKLAFQLLCKEIVEVSRGINLAKKKIADKRCEYLLKEPLWRNIVTNIQNQNLSEMIFEHLGEGITDFWSTWLNELYKGKSANLDIEFEIVMIPDEDWEKGPVHIAEKIEEIKARFLADKAPLAEKLELNPGTGKFFVTPIPARKPDLLNTTLEKASDALDDALNGRNGLLPDDRVARVLRRCLEKYTHNPERIEMDFVDTHAGLTRQMASGELADSEEILSLAEVLKNGALDIRANHPDIAVNRETRAARALQELTPEQKQQLADAQPILEALTENEAHQDMSADIPALINDMIEPVPDHAPPIGPAVRVVNRAAKISLMMRMKDFDTKLVEKCGYKSVEIFSTLGTVIGIGLGIFGLF